MQQYGMYFGKEDLYELIRATGGVWNDSKERPLVCMIKSLECEGLYWAIPVGNWNHRNKAAQDRIKKFMEYPETDMRSCYYHVGNTDQKSIFFISDVIPISDRYIEREYINPFSHKIHIIQNNELITAVEKKLKKVLAFENSRPNYFRQHITDVKNAIIKELSNS